MKNEKLIEIFSYGVEGLKQYLKQCQQILHTVDRGSDVVKYENILEIFLRKLK